MLFLFKKLFWAIFERFSLKTIFWKSKKGAREFVLNLPDTSGSIKLTIIDPQAADLVSRLLEWNPKKRPTTMEALQR